MSEQGRGVSAHRFPLESSPKKDHIPKNKMALKVVNSSSAVQPLYFTRHRVSKYAKLLCGFHSATLALSSQHLKVLLGAQIRAW